MFNREFVKVGLIQEDLADFYNGMYEFRQKGDYGDFVEFEKEKVSCWIKKAEEFLLAFDKVIAESLKKF